MSLPEEKIAAIKRKFSGYPEGDIENILRYRETKGRDAIAPILKAVLGHYLKENGVAESTDPAPDTTLDSLGLDSLAMLEIVLDISDALDIEIGDEELAEVKTVADLTNLIDSKVAA